MSVWIVIAVALLLLWMASARRNPLSLVPAAVRSGDLAPLRTALETTRAGPNDYDQVLKRLWNGYHREQAAEIAKDFATRHRAAPVSQYWLRKVMEDEPAIAASVFDEAFLARWYDPGVAATCGKCGSCSCG